MSVESFKQKAIEVCQRLYQIGKLFDWKEMHAEIEALKKIYNLLNAQEKSTKIDLMKTLSYADNNLNVQPFSLRPFLLKNTEDKSVEDWMNKIMAKYICCLLQLEINETNRIDFFKSDLKYFKIRFKAENHSIDESKYTKHDCLNEKTQIEIKNRIGAIKDTLKSLPENYRTSTEKKTFSIQLDQRYEELKNNFSRQVNLRGLRREIKKASLLLESFKGSNWLALHSTMIEIKKYYKPLTQHDKALLMQLWNGSYDVETTVQRQMDIQIAKYVRVIVNYPSLQLFELLGPSTSDYGQSVDEIMARISMAKEMVEFLLDDDIKNFFGKEKEEVLGDLDSLEINLMRAVELRKVGAQVREKVSELKDNVIEGVSGVGEKLYDLKNSALVWSQQGVSKVGSTAFNFKNKVVKGTTVFFYPQRAELNADDFFIVDEAEDNKNSNNNAVNSNSGKNEKNDSLRSLSIELRKSS